jgi:hypothetical protein
MTALSIMEPPLRAALQTCVSALRKLAAYQLDPVLGQRMLYLGENKEKLGPQEQAELMALVAFTQKRTVEKLEAELALQRLAAVIPDLVEQP